MIERDLCLAIRRRKLPKVDDDAPAKMSPDIGRYRGMLIRDIPTPYLQWLVTDFDPYPSQLAFVAAALLELELRHAL